MAMEPMLPAGDPRRYNAGSPPDPAGLPAAVEARGGAGVERAQVDRSGRHPRQVRDPLGRLGAPAHAPPFRRGR